MLLLGLCFCRLLPLKTEQALSILDQHQQQAMDSLYSVMQGLESRLGGGEGVEGIYGSITATGMHKVLECMKHNCGLGKSSTLIDIGAGLGRPLLHALMLHGIAHVYGVELDSVKVAKAEAFCKGVIDELALRGVLTNSSSSNNSSAKDSSSAADAAGKAAAAATARAEGGTTQAGSQGSDVSNVSDDTQVVLDCASQTDRPPKPAAAAAGKQADQPTGAAAAAGAQKAAQPPAAAAAAAVSGKKAAAKLKGEALLWPASRPIITCAAVEQIASLDPGTHAYSFWEGVPLSGKQAFGRLFRTSRTMKAVAVVQRAMRGQTPEAVMAELGFGPLLLIKAFPVNMSGSGRSFQAYVFSKVAPPAAQLLMRHALPAAQHQQQQDNSGTDVLASSTKPPRGSRLKPCPDSDDIDQPGADTTAAAAAAAAAEGDAAEDSSPDHQQQQEPLIELLTEQSIATMQQQQGHSPAKRSQPFLPAAAAGADADGSPSKKAKGAEGNAAAAAADGLTHRGSGLYGLRPRQLSQSYSSGGSSSGRVASTATTAGASSGRRTGLRSNSSSLSRGGSSASMSVDQPFARSGSSGRGSGGSSKGTRSTAVSGGGGSKGRGQSKQQQPEQQGGEEVADTKAAAAADAGGSRRVQRGAGSTVSAAVSDTRAAVAALDL